METGLVGKVALVTGANRGIGRGIAAALAKAGADVAVNFRSDEDEPAAKAVCSQIEGSGRRSLAVRADVSVGKEVSRMVETVQQQLGNISILVNNAGISKPQPIHEITEADWDLIHNVNLKSMFLVTQAVLPAMRKQRWG